MEETKKKQRPTVAQVKELEENIKVLRAENEALEHENKCLKENINAQLELLEKLRKEKDRELSFLKKRGFWARLLNK